MTAKEAIDNLEYLISEDCTESQFDYLDEIEVAIDTVIAALEDCLKRYAGEKGAREDEA